MEQPGYGVAVDMVAESLAHALYVATQYGLMYIVREEFGPGGGNPLVELAGVREQLVRYLVEIHGDEDGAYQELIDEL